MTEIVGTGDMAGASDGEIGDLAAYEAYLRDRLSMSEGRPATGKSLRIIAKRAVHGPSVGESLLTAALGDDDERTYDETNWRDGAHCRAGVLPADVSLDDFMPLPSEKEREARAKSVCNGDPTTGRPACLVAAYCLRHAIEKPEQHGIWGGMNEQELKTMRRRAKRV